MNRYVAPLFAIGFVVAMAVPAYADIDDETAAQIMTKAGCAICHNVEKKVIGPSYQEVAAKYKGDESAATTLTKSIREGSSGVYGGQIPMPPNPVAKISDADLKELVTWILSK